MLEELLKSKKKKEMEPKEKDAKRSVLKDIHDMAKSDMVDGIKAVKVASNSPEGLKAGLKIAGDKVEEMAKEHEGEMPGSKMPLESEEEEASEEKSEAKEEEPKEEISEMKDLDLSESEIEELMKILEEKKSKLLKK